MKICHILQTCQNIGVPFHKCLKLERCKSVCGRPYNVLQLLECLNILRNLGTKKSSSKDLRKIISVAFDIQGTVLRDVELHILWLCCSLTLQCFHIALRNLVLRQAVQRCTRVLTIHTIEYSHYPSFRDSLTKQIDRANTKRRTWTAEHEQYVLRNEKS